MSAHSQNPFPNLNVVFAGESVNKRLPDSCSAFAAPAACCSSCAANLLPVQTRVQTEGLSGTEGKMNRSAACLHSRYG